MNNICKWTCSTLAFLLIFSSIASYYFLNHGIQYLIKNELKLNFQNKAVYQSWQNPPIPIYMKIYFFNITNAQKIIESNEPLILSQMGPYTFLEKRTKVNVSINNDEGTISYKEKKTWLFQAQLSNGSLNDQLFHVNVPLVSMGNNIEQSGGEDFMYSFIKEFLNGKNITLFVKHTVEELLFKGYEDLILSDSIHMGLKVPSKFGFFFERNETISKIFKIYNGEKSFDNYGWIDSYDNKKQLNIWKQDTCNQINTSTTGDLNPLFQDHAFFQLKIFVNDLCRSLSLKFEKQIKHDKIVTNRYTLTENTFNYDLEDNKCYCLDNLQKCPKNGVFNNSICAEGAPIAISFPHFLYADTFYTKNIVGLDANIEKHQFFIDIEPTLGIAVQASAKLQINVFLRKNEKLDYTSHMTQDELYIPVLWISTDAKIDQDLLDNLNSVQNHLPEIKLFTSSILAITSIIILLSISILYIRSSKLNHHPQKNRGLIYTKVETTSFL